MQNRSDVSKKKYSFISMGLFLAFLFDLFLGTERLPIASLLVCGIVGVYAFISPYIYRPR